MYLGRFKEQNGGLHGKKRLMKTYIVLLTAIVTDEPGISLSPSHRFA
jgi:hypothetical protein